MKVYFDACCLHRILDERTHPRVNIEGEAMLNLLTLVEPGDLRLVSSEALRIEISRCDHPQRRAYVEDALELAVEFVRLDAKIEGRAKELVSQGFKGFDALHLACAETSVDVVFCTCDDRLY